MVRINAFKAYEKATGEEHIIEIFRKTSGSAAPYIVMLDGAFNADAESRKDAMIEVESILDWFDWSKTNPNYA